MLSQRNNQLSHKLAIGDNVKSSASIQVKPRKSLVVCQKNPIILSPTNKAANPEIVKPNFMNQSNKMNQQDSSSPTSLKGWSSVSDISYIRRSSNYSLQKPLDSLSPTLQKKTPQKKIRSSYSVDTSWSPNLNSNENEIRRSKFSYHSDDNEANDNQFLIEHSPVAASDDQVSPLCNCEADF